MFDYIIGKIILGPFIEKMASKYGEVYANKYDSDLPLGINIKIEQEAQKIGIGYFLIGMSLILAILAPYLWFMIIPFILIGIFIWFNGKKGLHKIEDDIMNL